MHVTCVSVDGEDAVVVGLTKEDIYKMFSTHHYRRTSVYYPRGRAVQIHLIVEGDDLALKDAADVLINELIDNGKPQEIVHEGGILGGSLML